MLALQAGSRGFKSLCPYHSQKEGPKHGIGAAKSKITGRKNFRIIEYNVGRKKVWRVKKRLFWKFWTFVKDPQTFEPLIFTNFNKVVHYIMEQDKK